MKKFLFSMILLLITSMAVAETRYVDDKLVIMMRTGMGNQFQIIETLPSGSRLELLGEEGQYANVRNEAGEEGWVLKQYLTATPVARLRLAAAEKKLQTAQSRSAHLQEQLAALKAEKGQLENEVTSLNTQVAQLQEELTSLRESAARPIELAEENRTLKADIANLQQSEQLLQQKNDRLEDNSQREWFMVGAAVLFGGILLGLILPMLRRKKTGMFS